MAARSSFFILVAVLYVTSSCRAQPAGSQSEMYPDTTWQKYASPEQAGWSSEKIEEVRTFADSLGSDAVILVHDGAVVAAWGYWTEVEAIASISKSLLSGLYGSVVASGTIDTSATLAELGVTGKPSLSRTEKQARVTDLLSMSSGIDQNPEDGRDISAKPGEQWYYNSWNFAALGTIYEQETGTNVFEAIQRLIAEPVGMEDYESRWGHYMSQPWRSAHPSHMIWMSARDLARFGLLYLRGGRWEGEQIVPAEWIEASTRPRFRNVVGDDMAVHYGLGFWVRGGKFAKYDTYFASGVGNQSIWILPQLDVVFVHRASRDYRQGVYGLEVEEMILRLVEARTGRAVDDPQFVPLVE